MSLVGGGGQVEATLCSVTATSRGRIGALTCEWDQATCYGSSLPLAMIKAVVWCLPSYSASTLSLWEVGASCLGSYLRPVSFWSVRV